MLTAAACLPQGQYKEKLANMGADGFMLSRMEAEDLEADLLAADTGAEVGEAAPGIFGAVDLPRAPDKDKQTQDGMTPLIIAAHNGHVRVENLLREKRDACVMM